LVFRQRSSVMRSSQLQAWGSRRGGGGDWADALFVMPAVGASATLGGDRETGRPVRVRSYDIANQQGRQVQGQADHDPGLDPDLKPFTRYQLSETGGGNRRPLFPLPGRTVQAILRKSPGSWRQAAQTGISGELFGFSAHIPGARGHLRFDLRLAFERNRVCASTAGE
jgi:hypothetical protein